MPQLQQILTKTITAATPGALDDAVAAFVQGLKSPNAQWLSTQFDVITGPVFYALITYTSA